MKRIFTLLITLIIFGNISFAQGKADVVNGIIKVKFKEENLKQSNNLFGNTVSSREITVDQKAGYVKTGIEGIDKLNQKYGVTKYTRIFRDAGKNEAKHRAYGLHLWYKVEFSTKALPNDMADDFLNSSSVEYANPEYKVQLTGLSETKSLSGAPNDPNFSDQWHYENTGQNSGTPGADISLLEAWTLETGNTNVIVAIEDGGIDWSHPDLAGNMWVNPGEIAGNGIDDDNNGYVDDIYGYNFGDNKGEIYVGDHGTHVAGTVGAETNNGIGVSGVAGGSGSNDGVRLMSCNVFAKATGGFEEAYTYAADNGAVISQNSWGYTSKDVVDQAVLDAIDYFVAEAGSPSAPMDGGIVIFAAGNDGSSGQWWPGCYDNVLAVAATNKNDERSYYSNYDTWVDVAAPGGELETSNTDPTAIHSTYPNGEYGVMQGTSMACPHVSGVAALIISRFAGTITPQEVFDRIVNNADNIDAQNPSYIGKLGSGRLNAFASLGGEVVVDEEIPSTPTNLASSNITESSVVLNWNASTDNIGVTGYDIYKNGTYLTTAANTNYTVTGLLASTTYSFYVKAKDAAGNSSNVSNTISVTTTEIVAQYCTSEGANFSYEWIAGVVVGDFSNTSGAAGYTDYTGMVAELTAGQSYNITLTPGFSGSTYDEYWKIWIDYNNDKDFDDAGELVFDAGTMSKAAVAGTITIPSTATGTTRMRVTMKYNAAPTACEPSFEYGEVEDYTVTILGGDTDAPTDPSNLVSSNLTMTSVDLAWNSSTDNVGVTGYDVYQDGSLLGSTATTTYAVSGLNSGVSYSYYVIAKDAVGNESGTSNTVNVTTNTDTDAPTAPSNLSSSSITTNSVALSWSASNDNVGVTGYDVYKNGVYLATTTATSYNASGLSVATTYSFYVKAKDAVGNISATSNTINVTTLDQVIVIDYCNLYAESARFEWIDIFGLNDLYNTSADNGGYGDYTNLSANVSLGSSYTASISTGYKRRAYTEYWNVWIDFNIDGEFTSDEIVVQGSVADDAVYTATVDIPATATIGQTRIRVAMSDAGYPVSCGSFKYGEVEDYTVNISNESMQFTTILDGKVLSNDEVNSINVFPNPAKDKLFVDVPFDNAKVRIINSTGAILKELVLNENTIDISDLNSGLYILLIEDEKGPIKASFVKQ